MYVSHFIIIFTEYYNFKFYNSTFYCNRFQNIAYLNKFWNPLQNTLIRILTGIKRVKIMIFYNMLFTDFFTF